VYSLRRQSESSSYHGSSISASRSSTEALIPALVRELQKEKEMLLPLPKDVENLADDPQLHNPLKRSERMGTGWFGVSLWKELSRSSILAILMGL
jgi:hypothetical protein